VLENSLIFFPACGGKRSSQETTYSMTHVNITIKQQKEKANSKQQTAVLILVI
jgi:hypothetical protein